MRKRLLLLCISRLVVHGLETADTDIEKRIMNTVLVSEAGIRDNSETAAIEDESLVTVNDVDYEVTSTDVWHPVSATSHVLPDLPDLPDLLPNLGLVRPMMPLVTFFLILISSPLLAGTSSWLVG